MRPKLARALMFGLLAALVAPALTSCGTGQGAHSCYQTRSEGGIECVPIGSLEPSREALDVDGDGVEDSFLCANGSAQPPSAAGASGSGSSRCGAGKVLICHYPPGNPANAHELCVGSPAVSAHVSNHGDRVGPCGPAGGPDGGGPADAGGVGSCGAGQPQLDSDHDGVPDELDCDAPCGALSSDGGPGRPTGGSGAGTPDAGAGPGGSGPPGPSVGSPDGGPGGGGPRGDAGSVGSPPPIRWPPQRLPEPGPDPVPFNEPPPPDPSTVEATPVEPLPASPPPPPRQVGYSGWAFGCSAAGAASGGGLWGALLAGAAGLGLRRRRSGAQAARGALATARRVTQWAPLVGAVLLAASGRASPAEPPASWVAPAAAGAPRSAALVAPAAIAAMSTEARGFAAPLGSAPASAASATPAATVAPDGRNDPVVATTVRELPPTPSPESYARLHLLGGGFAEVVSRQGGFELGATLAATGHWDFGAAVVIGKHVGYRGLAEWHPVRPGAFWLLPFVQARAIVHPVPEGVGLGLGTWAGASLEVGPGRARAGLLAEGYYGPPGYYPYAAFFLAAYELDLLEPSRVLEYRDRLTEVVRERTVPAPSTATVLRVRVTDLDDAPLTAQVRVTEIPGAAPSFQLSAAPEAESPIPPGAYRAEVFAEGYLRAGGSFAVRPGETLVEHFRLRPVPKQPAAQLTAERIEVSQRVEFAFDTATLAPSSFALLDEVVDILHRHPELEIRVEGHTCSMGTAEYNQQLSAARAKSVITFLTAKGIEARRLTPIGFGLARPIADNGTEEGRVKNRRVQFEIVPAAPVAPAVGRAAPRDRRDHRTYVSRTGPAPW